MNSYEGKREGYPRPVLVNGEPLNPRYDLRNHSPSGFEWGYGGSGPAQLALAILAHECGSEIAIKHYLAFKEKVISHITSGMWVLTSSQIRKFLDTQGENNE